MTNLPTETKFQTVAKYRADIPRPGTGPWRGPNPDLSFVDLIPVGDCHAIIAECEADTEPIGTDAAAKFAATLVGHFPNAGPHDPETYLAGLAVEIREYPITVVQAAMRRLVREHKFVPAIAEVHEELANIRTRMNWAREWARLNLAEHERRHAEQRRREEVEAERQEVIDRNRRRLRRDIAKAAKAGPLKG